MATVVFMLLSDIVVMFLTLQQEKNGESFVPAVLLVQKRLRSSDFLHLIITMMCKHVFPPNTQELFYSLNVNSNVEMLIINLI